MSDELLIVSTLTDDEGIFVYRIADSDGKLEKVSQTAQSISNPFFIDLHPSKDVLYSITDPGGAAELFVVGVQGRAQVTETRQQQPGQVQSRVPGDAAADEDGQQLGVGKRLDAPGQKLFPGALHRRPVLDSHVVLHGGWAGG